MKLFKTAISVVLAVVMAGAILPFAGKDVKADTKKNQLQINGIKVDDTNKNDILGDGSLVYDSEASKLTFVKPTEVIDSTDNYAIVFQGDSLTISGEGSFISQKGFGCLMVGDLIIDEGSKIKFEGFNTGLANLEGNLTVKGILTLNATSTKKNDGVAGIVIGSITLDDPDAMLLGNGYAGIACESAFNLNSGYVYIKSTDVGLMANYIHLGDGIEMTLPVDGKFAQDGMAEYVASSNGKDYATMIKFESTGKSTKINYDIECDGTFGDFIERLYNVALNRQSEAEGKEFWVNTVTKGENTGADCARGFLFSAEFKNRGLSREQFLDVLYATFFKREADADGKAYWMAELAKGTSMDTIINNFINSREWCDICASYGVRSGAPTAKATFASANAKAFATRLYEKCLGRDPETEGLNFWALSLTNQEVSGYEAAKQFFNSKEFQDKNYDNKEFVKRCYTTFMGRDYDESGLNYWVKLLDDGSTRDDVLIGFAQSKEFTDICNSYGILRGI